MLQSIKEAPSQGFAGVSEAVHSVSGCFRMFKRLLGGVSDGFEGALEISSAFQGDFEAFQCILESA